MTSSYVSPTKPSRSTVPAPPPAPVTPGVHPWRRWWARILDLSIAGFVGGFTATMLGFNAAEIPNVAAVMILAFCWMPAEAVLMATFGQTPGKALMNLHVLRDGDRTALSIEDAMRRAVMVYIIGLAFALPLISLFSMAHQHSQLRKNGTTSYDRGRFTVVSGEISGARIVAAYLVSAIILFMWGASFSAAGH